MSMGTSPPTAAVDQDASRNSRPVLIKSAARVRTFSGSQISSGAPAGRWSGSVASSVGLSSGSSASMPSTGMPSASLASMSGTDPGTLFSTTGCSAARAAARSRTSSVSSSSRQGTAMTVSMSISGMERWSATENIRISETSSPQNSTRTGCSRVGGNTSRMPPRTANSPRLPTMSTRV